MYEFLLGKIKKRYLLVRSLDGKKKNKVHPCTGTEALYRLYGP
jgi:hypothetical protein